jgi:hypothetical protein
MQTSGTSCRENVDTHSAVIVREGGRSSIPETLMIESIGRGVLDTRLRGYDDLMLPFFVPRDGLLRFARNDVEGPLRIEYPTYAAYEDSLAPRKIRRAWQRDRGFTDASHAHVKGRFSGSN